MSISVARNPMLRMHSSYMIVKSLWIVPLFIQPCRCRVAAATQTCVHRMTSCIAVLGCGLHARQARDPLRLAYGLRRFFGGFGFGMGGEEEETTPKGNDVFVELEVSLRDLYLGQQFEVRPLARTMQAFKHIAAALVLGFDRTLAEGTGCRLHDISFRRGMSHASHPCLQARMCALSASYGAVATDCLSRVLLLTEVTVGARRAMWDGMRCDAHLFSITSKEHVCLAVQVVRDKNVVKPARGTRQCNCKNKMVTRQLGPGMFQQYQTQVRQERRSLRHLRLCWSRGHVTQMSG